MIKPDVIVTLPNTGVDFPMWRYYMFRHSAKFEKIIIGMTNQGDDFEYAKFLQENLPGNAIVFTQLTAPKTDWRDEIVNAALNKSSSPRVWFMEPDILMTDNFIESVVLSDVDMICIKEIGRIHPASLLVKRELIDKTSRDFMAHPPQYDHFDLFTEELSKLYKTQLIRESGYKHLAGLTHNYHIALDKPRDVYKPAEFSAYNDCLKYVPVQIYPSFQALLDKLNFFFIPVPEIKNYFFEFVGDDRLR